MQEYPTHLLPRSEYRIIEQDNLHSQPDMFLIRHIESDKLSYIDGTNILNPDCITIQSNHLHDLSCNLLGIFMEKDVCYGINKNIENTFWIEGTNTDKPSPEEFFIDEKRGHYFVNIDLLLKTTFPTNEGETCHFTILHTPVKYNFWHVSIRVLDSDGIEIKNSKKGKQQKRILQTARNFLLTDEIISQSVGSYAVIPETNYTNPV
jgi:uncharacterized protein YxjI